MAEAEVVLTRAQPRRQDEKYGRGEVTLDDSWLDSPERSVLKLRAMFGAPDFVPPTVPKVALDLMQLTRQPGVELKEIAELLEKDPFLAAHILKIANSPLYAGGKKFHSLRDASVRLGLKNLHNLILEASLRMVVSRVRGFSDLLQSLWTHSRATAILSRAVARYTALEGEYAFSCGLLHDIGVAGGLVAISAAAQGIELSAQSPLLSAVMEVHEEASAIILRLWGLPEELLWVVSHHHQINTTEPVHPLSATVCVADHLAKQLGFSLGPMLHEQVAQFAFTHSAKLLGVEAKLELIVKDAEDELVMLRDEA